MTFSGHIRILAIRTIQVLMILFSITLSIGTPQDPIIETVWYTGLCAIQWFGYNIVEASIDESGVSYRRYNGVKHVTWAMIDSAILWRAAGGVILKLKGRNILRRYKFLLDSKPGIEVLVETYLSPEPAEITELRKKITRSI